MKRISLFFILYAFVFGGVLFGAQAKTTRIASPNGKLVVELNTEKGEFGWMVFQNGTPVYIERNISLTIGVILRNIKLKVLN